MLHGDHVITTRSSTSDIIHAIECQLITGYKQMVTGCKTRGQSNLTKSASRGAHSPVRGHPRGSKVVPLNSWGRVSY